MNNDFFMMFPNMEYEERMLIENITKDFSEEDLKKFFMVYQGKRHDAQNILIFTLLGFLGFAGIQRFVTNDILLGVLYFFTLGFCWIGTIVDLINYKSITLNHNRQKALEVVNMMQMQKPQQKNNL